MPTPNLLKKYGVEGQAKTETKTGNGLPRLIDKYKAEPAPQPAPVPVTPAPKPSLLSRAGDAFSRGVEKVTGRPDYETKPASTSVLKNTLRELPSAITETILPGVKALRDNPELVYDQNIRPTDLAKEVPGQVLETGKTFVKAVPKGATEIPGLVTGGAYNPAISFKLPVLGDVKNSQAILNERAAAGENITPTDVIAEKSQGLLDALFFISLAAKPFTSRPSPITQKGEVKVGPETGVPVTEGPKTGRLYQPSEQVRPVPNQVFENIVKENNIPLRTDYNPSNPVIFKVSGATPDGLATGQFFQIKPSFLRSFINIFKGDPTKVPQGQLVPITQEIAQQQAKAPAQAPQVVPPISAPKVPTNESLPPVATEKASEVISNEPRKLSVVSSEPPTRVKLPNQPGNVPQPVVEINGEQVPTPDQLVTKSQVRDMLKGLGQDSVDFKVAEENGVKYLTYKTDTNDLKLRPSALGLVEDNLTPGDVINISRGGLSKPGTSFRAVNGVGGVEASLKKDNETQNIKPATSPEELANRIDQLNKFGQSYAILRRTGGLSKKAAGIFRHGPKAPEKGIVHLQDDVVKAHRQYMETLAHELGHALEFNLTGSTNKDTFRVFGKDLPEEVKNKIREELKKVTHSLVGEETAKGGAGYYYKNTELLARFLEKMFASPGDLGELAPTAMEYIQKSAIENPIIADYLEAVEGKIDLGERKHIFFRDMKQTYQKLLGKRVGELAWNDEVRYRAMKERSKIVIEKFIKDKFKNIKDDPGLLFRAAESIKVTKDGEPEFGTQDFQYAKNDNEAVKLVENGYEIVKDASGDPVMEYEDGTPYTRYARTRYTPEQGKAFFDALSPEGQKLIKDFTAQRSEAKDYFNRETIKAVHKINSDLEGWVHHYWEEKGSVGGKNRLKTKLAAAQKQRKGAEGYVEDLQKAMTKALTELETTKAYNEFIKDYFARVTKPIAKGEKPEPGYVEVQGDVTKGGVGTYPEMRLAVLKDRQMFNAQRPRYQMPAVIYERYKMLSDFAVEASTAVKTINSINRYWRVNILFHPGSAATNFISGGIQYATKVLTDFYVEVLTGNIKFEKTRSDIFAMLKVLQPKGWDNAPDWIYGGDLSNFYGQFGRQKTPGILDKSVDAYADKTLKLYGAVERYWKKVIATAENASTLENLTKVDKNGLRVPTKEEQAIIDDINSEIDLFAYDYDNVPVQLDQFNKNVLGSAVKPFLKYPYKYSKHITELIGAAFDQTLPWQERMAKILALATIVAAYAYAREKAKNKKKTPEVPETAPPSVSTRGRFYIGTDKDGNELFTRTAKYPFINLTEAGELFAEGNSAQGAQVIQDMINSVGPAGDIALATLGYSNQYQQYTPLSSRLGSVAASFVPGTRILSDISRFFDPYQRKPSTFLQNVTSLIPLPAASEDLRKKLRGDIRTIQVPLEGNIQPNAGEGTRRTTTDMFVKNYKLDILAGLLGGIYINRIDPDVAQAFVTRKAENDAKKAKK